MFNFNKSHTRSFLGFKEICRKLQIFNFMKFLFHFEGVQLSRIFGKDFTWSKISKTQILKTGMISTGCPKKHWNSVTNWISSLLLLGIVIPNFKSHIIMSARVYFMKTVNGCKDVSIMSPQDKQWRLASLLCLYTAIFLFY